MLRTGLLSSERKQFNAYSIVFFSLLSYTIRPPFVLSTPVMEMFSMETKEENISHSIGYIGYSSSTSERRLEALSWDCARDNHASQMKIAPNWIYAAGSPGGSVGPGKLDLWEPLVEQIPKCNGLSSGLLKEFQFLVVLDKSWIDYYEENKQFFSNQGYWTLQQSSNIWFDRASYLFEAQFGVRVVARQVVPLENLEENCAGNNNHADDGSFRTSTLKQLEAAGISRLDTDANIIRLGVDPDGVYCHSTASYSACEDYGVMTVMERPFVEGTNGELSNSKTFAHELGHVFGICYDNNHPHCLNYHTANEIPDIMVWNGTPATNARPQGLFYKFMTSCTPVYKNLLCGAVKAGTCGKTVDTGVFSGPIVSAGIPIDAEHSKCVPYSWGYGFATDGNYNNRVYGSQCESQELVFDLLESKTVLGMKYVFCSNLGTSNGSVNLFTLSTSETANGEYTQVFASAIPEMTQGSGISVGDKLAFTLPENSRGRFWKFNALENHGNLNSFWTCEIELYGSKNTCTEKWNTNILHSVFISQKGRPIALFKKCGSIKKLQPWMKKKICAHTRISIQQKFSAAVVCDKTCVSCSGNDCKEKSSDTFLHKIREVNGIPKKPKRI